MNIKFKNIIQVIIILSYIFMIGVITLSIIDDITYIIKENWLITLNLILMCVGFYYFINSDKSN